MTDDIWAGAFNSPLNKKEADFLWTSDSFTKDLRSNSILPARNSARNPKSSYLTENTDSFIPMSGNVKTYQFQTHLDGGDQFDVVGYELDEQGNPVREFLQNKMPEPDKEYASVIGTEAIQLKRCMGESRRRIPKTEVEHVINPPDMMHGDAELSDARLAQQTELFSRSTYFNKAHQQDLSHIDTGREMYNGYNLKDPHSFRTNSVENTQREEDARSVPVMANPTIEESIQPARRVKEQQSSPFTRTPMHGANETSTDKRVVQLKPEQLHAQRCPVPYLDSAVVNQTEINITRGDATKLKHEKKHSHVEMNSNNIVPVVSNESNRDLKGKEGNVDNLTGQRTNDAAVDFLPTRRDEPLSVKAATHQQEIVASLPRPEVEVCTDDTEISEITKNIKSLAASSVRPAVILGEKDDYEQKKKHAKSIETGNRTRPGEDVVLQQRETKNELKNNESSFVNTSTSAYSYINPGTQREEESTHKKLSNISVGNYVTAGHTEQVTQMREHMGKMKSAYVNTEIKNGTDHDAPEQLREHTPSLTRNFNLPMSNNAAISICDNLETLREDAVHDVARSHFNSNQIVNAEISVTDRTDADKINREAPEPQISAHVRPDLYKSLGKRNDGREIPRIHTGLKTIPQIRGNISLKSTAGTKLLPDRLATVAKHCDKRRDLRTTPTPSVKKDRSTPTRMLTGRNTPLEIGRAHV